MTVSPSLKNSPAAIDLVPFKGWPNNLRVGNGTVELIVTLDVGPRILSYSKPGGFNPFKVYEDQAGTAGESTWRNRGGHRLWIAPEHAQQTYFPDNSPVAWEKIGPLAVRLTPPPEAGNHLQKQLEITLDPTGTGVTILHRVTQLGAKATSLAPWALTVMTPGGVAIVPQPPLGEHPRDLLPNRKVVLWPYTDLSDRRWHFGSKYIRLKQEPAGQPTKIGLAHEIGWCGYLVEGVFFLKRYPWHPAANYPDQGCNFEMFSNGKMLELESLGPLTSLPRGESVEHVERWELHEGPDPSAIDAELRLDQYIGSIVEKAAPAK